MNDMLAIKNKIIAVLLSPEFKKLTCREQKVYKLYRVGTSFKDISIQLGIDIKSVYNFKYTAEKKILLLADILTSCDL